MKREHYERYFQEMARMGFSYAETDAIRRDAQRMTAWAVHECNGTKERRDDGTCWSVWNTQGSGPIRYSRTPDLETPAQARIEALVKRHRGIRAVFQGDPRGAVVRICKIRDVENHGGAVPPCEG